MHETVAGLARAIAFFGYKPSLIQTDNGSEFSDRALTKDGKKAANREGPNAFDRFCEAEGIAHKFIKPRTPEHNGKVERSHRTDQEKFYRTPKMALKLKSPNEVELEKLRKLFDDTGEIRCKKLRKRFTSIDN